MRELGQSWGRETVNVSLIRCDVDRLLDAVRDASILAMPNKMPRCLHLRFAAIDARGLVLLWAGAVGI